MHIIVCGQLPVHICSTASLTWKYSLCAATRESQVYNQETVAIIYPPSSWMRHKGEKRKETVKPGKKNLDSIDWLNQWSTQRVSFAKQMAANCSACIKHILEILYFDRGGMTLSLQKQVGK